MKYIWIALVFIFFSDLQAQTPQFEIDEKLYVVAYNGLNLRTEPNTQSPVVMKVDHGTEVIVLGQGEHLDNIDSRFSRWVHVQVGSKVGYLYGGYLTRHSALLLDDADFNCYSTSDLHKFLTRIMSEDSVVHQKEIYYEGDGEKDAHLVNYKHFENGNSFAISSGYEWMSYVFESYEFSLNDIMNIMEYYIAYSHKYCSQFDNTRISVLSPIKDRSGRLIKIKTSYPLAMTAYKVGFKTIVEFEETY